MLAICSASAFYSKRDVENPMRAVETALNRQFGVKDFSAVMTDEYDEVWDSYFSRCICWDRVQQGDFWNEHPKRVYVWRAFYGLVIDPTKQSSQQQSVQQSDNMIDPSELNPSGEEGLGNVGTALGVGLAMPLALVLGILELTTTTTPRPRPRHVCTAS